jgi:lysine-specific demethylase/histidyl-hydroxylase NO66
MRVRARQYRVRTTAAPMVAPDLHGSSAVSPREGGTALERCVGDRQEFAARYWSIGPLLRHGQGFDDLLSFDDVDELIADRGLRTPFIRIVRDGAIVEPDRYTGGGGPGAEIGDQVHDDRVLAQWLDGSTIVLQGLHRTWPPLREFCLDLAEELGCAVQANAYLTPAGSTGFATHYDTHDVFVLHCAGYKRWRIHQPVQPDPLDRQGWGRRAAEVAARADGTAVIDHVLATGDVLYLPRGWLHTASAQAEPSLHITLGLRRLTRYGLVEALLAEAADEAELRRGFPAGVDLTDPDQLAPHLDATIKTLQGWLQTVTPTQLAVRLAGAGGRRRPGAVRPVAQAAAAASLSLDAEVRVRAGLGYRVTTVGDRTRLELPDRTISLPAQCEAALRLLLAGPPVRVSELPGLDSAADGLVLVRRMLREAVVVPSR